MKTRYLKFVAILHIVLFVGCKSSKIYLTSIGENGDVAINNAILDFSNSCKLYKNYSMFYVWLEDSVFHLVFNYEDQQWQRNEFYDDRIIVHISPHQVSKPCEEHCDKYLYTVETKVGSKGKLPSRYMEKDGKLFFWWDNEYSLSEEMLTILWKYDLLYDDTEGLIGFPEFTTNEKTKGAVYYFCKSDFNKYKRVVTNIGSGYYKPPKLKCNKIKCK